MAHKKKTKQQEIIPADLAETEAKLKARIADIENLPDAGERLIKYTALRDDAEKLYDSKQKIPGGTKGSSETQAKYTRGYSTLALIGGVFACLNFPLLPVFITAAVLFVSSPFIGNWIGKKVGRSRYDNHTAVEKFATRMDEMVGGIKASIKKLKTSYMNDIKTLGDSVCSEQVQKEFTDLGAAFKMYSERKAFVAEEPTAASPAVMRMANKPAAAA